MKKRYLITVFALAFVLILPQFVLKGFIVGSDEVFHFNRFMILVNKLKTVTFNILSRCMDFSSREELLMPFMVLFLPISKDY